MENAVWILVALLLGYGQGIKKKRKREGKEGGIVHNITDRITRKGRLIQEHNEEIFNLKEEIIKLKRKQENNNKEGCYSKGNISNFKRDLLFFVWNSESKELEAIKCLFFLSILIKTIPEIAEEKFTKFSWNTALDKINTFMIERKEATYLKIGCTEYAFDFEEVFPVAFHFFFYDDEFENNDYDITYEEMKEVFLEVLGKLSR